MSLIQGTKVGHYEILALIGAGGMGEVYRARDTKLKRDVALKVLPEVFARDADRYARFQREAELLASLNQPNIATIYGVEERALAMELVEGETLSGPLPLETALNYARQIAEALEYAHDRGVIHRDLKPANIKITGEGTVKLLDFGLAKAVEDPLNRSADLSNSPTLSLGATRVGVIIGTAAYMSPEQAGGRPADRRADIWSFGAVLYEMLTGKLAFPGDSVSDTLATVLKLEPDWSALPPATPAAIEKLVRRCLTKDRKQRLQAIGEARIMLENLVSEAPTETAARSRGWLSYAAGWVAAALLAIAVPAAWMLKPVPNVERNVVRFTEMAPFANVIGGLALSRDGTRLAFVGRPQQQIYVRELDQLEARPVAGTEGASHISFSPDGEWISFITGERAGEGRLKKVLVAGGSVQTLAPVVSLVGPPVQTWGEDDNILFSSEGMLKRISANGGQPETLAAPDRMKAEAYYAGGQMLPDHRTVLVSVNVRAGGGSHRLVALDTRTGNQKTVLENAGIVRYAPSSPGSQVGYLIYYDPPTGSLVAASFNAERLTVNGTPVPIIEGVQSLAGPFGVFAFSDNGSLIYVRATGTFGERTLVWVDRNGGEQPTAAPLRPYNLPRLSPAGDRVAVEVQDPRTQTVDIWVYDLLRGSATRITHQNRNVFPVWMPDGKRLLLGSGTAPTYVLASAPADGSTAPVPISTSSEAGCFPDSVSPDAKLVIGRGRGGRGGRGNSTCLWSLAEASAIKVTQNDFGRIDMQFSPDGRFVAYTSNESGRNEIYIEPAPGAPSGTGGKHTISVDGGNTPRWSRTGRELFYLNTGKMMAVDIQTSPSFTAGKPKMLFEGPYSNGYDVAPDGKRFLMVKANAPPTATAQTELHFVLNWFEELQRRAPAAK